MAGALGQETADVLARLIRFKTVNPPGAERECQEWLKEYLEQAGFAVELMGAEPERPNLVATLKGAAPGEPRPPGEGGPSRGQAWAICRTWTPCSPTPTTGAATPGPATSRTGTC